MPDSYALDHLPVEVREELASRAGGEVQDTTLNGFYFAVPLSREADMISVLRSAGYRVRRDDGLVARIGFPE